jgi:bacteriorhodopsin
MPDLMALWPMWLWAGVALALLCAQLFVCGMKSAEVSAETIIIAVAWPIFFPVFIFLWIGWLLWKAGQLTARFLQNPPTEAQDD